MRTYLTERATHIATARPGMLAARALSDKTDEAVRRLCLDACCGVRARWAVVALGGWGAGRLLPSSDLDLLVLHDMKASEAREFVERVLYPLWDSGLKVGHQVRTPREQNAAMREDLKSLTAALTARPVAGDTDWASGTLSKCVGSATKRGSRWLAELGRRPRPGSPYGLEPELKEGAGGQRDFDELIWSASLLCGTSGAGLEQLEQRGLLNAHERRDAEHAAEVLATARWVMQRDGSGDRLTSDGCLDPASAGDVQQAVILIARTLDDVRDRVAGRPVPREPLSAADLFDTLDQGEEGLPHLLRAAASGRLDVVIPGTAGLLSLRRPGLGHELTVGAHSLHVAALVVAAEDDPGPLGRSADLSSRRVVQVAALLHDVGKVEESPGHPERGSMLASAVAGPILGEDEGAPETVAQLVKLHLLLIETAMSGNLDDEDTVLACAAKVGDRSLVAPLHVLSAVDSMATGASVWGPWKSTLVASLVARLDVALMPDVDGAGMALAAEKTRAAALTLLSDSDEGAAFVQRAPIRYLASRDSSEVAAQARLVGELCGRHGAKVLLSVGAGPARGVQTINVAALDRPELLERLAGAVALAGLDILGLEAFRGPGDVVLHTLVVTSATDKPVTTETFSLLERLMDSALADRLSLRTRLRERRRHYPARATGSATARTDRTGWYTALFVTAPDRPGLLHDIAQVVSSHGLDIQWARADTVDGMAKDVFHITGSDGGPVSDPGLLGHTCATIRERL